MFDSFLISKKEIIKFKVRPKNPFGLSCEKVTQTPRAFNTEQIKNATENISFLYDDEDGVPELPKKVIEHTLKDLFLYMHQTGLYNRQFKLWKTIGNITQCSISKLQKGLLKKKDLSAYIVDFYIDPKTPCFNAIISEDSTISNGQDSFYQNFKTCLSKVLRSGKSNRLKGVFYFLGAEPSEDFITKLEFMTNVSDSVSRYESILLNTKDVRLNVVVFKQNDGKYNYEYVFPIIKLSKHKKEKI